MEKLRGLGPGAIGRGDALRRMPKPERHDHCLRQSQLGSHRGTQPGQSKGEVENIGDTDLTGWVMPCELTVHVFLIMQRALQIHDTL